MFIRLLEQKLRTKFPKANFDFRISRVKGVDLESNLFFILQDKEKLGLEDLNKKYKADLEKVFFKFGMTKDNFKIQTNGFLNINLDNPELLGKELIKILDKKEQYFKSSDLKNKKINLEFVSANPTGALHIGNLRGGPVGEILAKLLKDRRAKVTKEYYVNDLGVQTELFAKSVFFHLLNDKEKFAFPKNGYKGEYPKRIAQKLSNQKKFSSEEIMSGISKKTFIESLHKPIVELVLQEIKDNLKQINITFDNFVFESDLKSKTKEVLEKLKEKNVVKKKNGALWFESESHRDLLGDRECVLVRSNGEPTYFLNDVTYHLDKFERGFDILIDVWGANHFGHAPRIWAALEVLGYKRENLKIIFYQPVSLEKDKKKLMMSKRAGSYVNVNEILKSADKDIFKIYLLEKRLNSPIVFDWYKFKAKRKQSLAFYIKYMSARINGIFKKVAEPEDEPVLKKLNRADWELLKRILFLNYKAYKTTEILEPHLFYEETMKLVDSFHVFYEKNPIKNEKDKGLKKARFAILKAVDISLQYIGQTLGIDLPKKM